jgi:hypothetical protein
MESLEIDPESRTGAGGGMEYLSADEILAGGTLVFDVEVPSHVLLPSANPDDPVPEGPGGKVKLRPLTVRLLQQLTRAAKDNDGLLSTLMLKEALVEPRLNLDQVNGLHSGLARFLLDSVNRISGISQGQGLEDAVQAPMAKACFVLAKEFGWSPEEVGKMTMAQILLYLEMIKQNRQSETVTAT